jgi:ubiquinol-cytochrome c reductase cytochrome b subunit
MQGLRDWLDARTGYRQTLTQLTGRTLPDGPSWWLTSASCLLWLFIVQLLTGLLLMTAYSPSTTSAWASVHFIESSPWGGLVRGVHYFAAHALIIVFAIHVLRVLLTAGFRAPRELVWLTGLLLMPLILAWAVTGNPLCGSQKAVAQIDVEGNIVASTPLIGPSLRQLLIGGEEVGNLTLTHLYFLHVGLMPLLGIGLLAIHLTQVYRHGSVPGDPAMGSRNIPYWPYQTARNATVVAAVFAVISLLAWRYGAPLDAPADPDLASMPRPEWYFRSLFELRRYFTGEWEFVATLVLPLTVLLFFTSLPFLEWLLSRRLSLLLRVLVIIGAVGAWGWLTGTSLVRDWNDGDYQAAQVQAAQVAARARALADRQQIPPEGASALLHGDPKTRGPMLFARHCAGCHSHSDNQGNGLIATDPSAPNLLAFGNEEWIVGMLDPDLIGGPHYFGRTKFADGEMVSHIKDLFGEGADARELRGKLRLAALALAAEAEQPAASAGGSHEAEAVTEGRTLISGELGCTDCHRFHDQGELGSAPDLTGYGSRQWLAGMIANPQSERFYAADRNDRMPAFAKEPGQSQQNLLSPVEIDLLVDWLRGQWYEPEPSPPSQQRVSGRHSPVAASE